MMTHCKVYGRAAVSCAKTSEPIEMPLGFGLGLAQRSMWGAHCRHLANTNKPSMCGGDAACCQITLTIFLHSDSGFHGLSICAL